MTTEIMVTQGFGAAKRLDDGRYRIIVYGEAEADLAMRAPELLAENEMLKARIAELEAAQKWRPIEDIPFNKPVILFDAKTWAIASAVEVHEGHRIMVDAEYMQATHFMNMPKMEDE